MEINIFSKIYPSMIFQFSLTLKSGAGIKERIKIKINGITINNNARIKNGIINQIFFRSKLK
jgi:hypothetical protein